MSRNVQAAYHLIQKDLVEYCDKLLGSFRPCRFWIHESVVARFIGLPVGTEHGQSEALTSLLACIAKGSGGDKKKKTQKATTRNAVDLQNKKNGTRVCYQQWGAKEPFERGADSTEPLMRRPRWFKFGMDDTIELGVQNDIVNELVGKRAPATVNDNNSSIPVFVAKRWHKYYVPFYKGQMRDCVPYNNFDVPAVAFKYLWLWPEIEMTSDKVRRRSFPVEDLQTIENDFCLMIVSTNILGKGGKVVLHNNFLCPARNTRESCTPVVINTTPSSTTPSSNPPLDSHHVLQNETPLQNDASHTANDASFPDALRAYCLRCTDDCTIYWDMTPGLASIN